MDNEKNIKLLLDLQQLDRLIGKAGSLVEWIELLLDREFCILYTSSAGSLADG